VSTIVHGWHPGVKIPLNLTICIAILIFYHR
jgi:hypothetical protein